MQHVIHALDHATGHFEVGQIALHELDSGKMREVLPLAGDQVIHDTNALAAAYEFFREMGADEPGAAGNEVSGHISV
jgi:hypothetical protein